MQQVKQDLRISSKTENISLVEGLVDDICDKHKINEDYYGNILIALTEAVTNAILHGNKGDVHKFVDVSYFNQDKELCFVIKDEGPGFDVNALPDPTAPENIEKPTGRGVFLMRNLADKIEFEDSGRTVKLYFNIAG